MEGDSIQRAGHVSAFEQAKRTTEDGFDYWQSRELSIILQYEDYRNFEAVIAKAKTACGNGTDVPFSSRHGDAEQRHTARVLPHDPDTTRVPIHLLAMH